ncbi:pyridoxamine 5'-phosphate oxidase family protein [Nisaea sp.]|uniref:pyridoxamine 5'-phosphate oxidase family protein n=1 Tax=Nisaea sp. TaxID=2024842 RepID=UPI0032EFA34F
MSEPPKRDVDAAALIDRASALFSTAPQDPQASFRYPVLATIGRDGTPNGRVLVLRTADPGTWQATLHTDGRAEKLAELAAHNAAMLVFYDHAAGLQLRLKGAMATLTDTAARKAIWDTLADSNRPNYRADPPTGSVLGAAGDGIGPDDDQTGFENFTVLTFSAATVDVLKLARTGNRRYRLDLSKGTGTWLVP